ncbi:MAG: hormogonium polysaccharide biosynthesis glycosyltransferase HpsE [Coleofasciculaceae cyanobacterium]
MIVDLTVAIPTYNGEKRLPEVLECLLIFCQRQSAGKTEYFSWEVIVVDNNSTDSTAQIVQSYQQSWPCQYPLRYCFEPQQGAAFARKLAVKKAQGKLVGFLDDDNLPAANWLEAAYAFAQEHPQAGAYGSQIHGAFEKTPPENFHRLAPFLAITERGSQPLRYEPTKKVLPPSAGLVVRKQAWLESVPPEQILTGRTLNNVVTSEDLEILCYIQAKGWEIWYNPAMEINHKIPSWRLEREYLLSLLQGIGLSRHVTRMLSVKPWFRPFALLAYLANDLRKIALHLLKYRQHVRTDLVAACEMQLFVSSLISPIYLSSKGLRKAKRQ